MKKVLILMFAVAVLAGCATWRINRWEGFWGEGSIYPRISEMFETLTGIPAWAVKTSEQVSIHSRNINTLSLIRTISLMRMTDANVTYMLVAFRLKDCPPLVTLVIGGREVTLKTKTGATPGGEFQAELVLAEVPPEDVEELFASDDIRIQCWDGPAIKLTEKEISYLRLLSPHKPQ